MSIPSPWIEKLNLMPHPEGGFYNEIYRCPETCTPNGAFEGSRSLATGIYYLLPSGSFSAFHRLRSDEIWTHLDGGTITIHMISPEGRYSIQELGSDFRSDARPVAVIPRNCWFAAEPARHTDSLAACFVAPGFDFKDFEIAARDALCDLCPGRKQLIERLTLG